MSVERIRGLRAAKRPPVVGARATPTGASACHARGAGWPDEDVWRGLQAEAREEERDWAQWEAEREEPATEDGGWDG